MSILHCGYCAFCSASLEKLGYCICQGFNPSLIWLPESGKRKYMYYLEKVCKKSWILNPTTLHIKKKVIIYFTVVGIIFRALSIEIETWLHYLIGTLSNKNVASWMSRMVTRSWYFLSFSALTWQICTTGVKTKAFRFVVWDKSVLSSRTSNFWLLVMTSGMSAFSLLKLTNNKDLKQQWLWQLGEWQQKQ